jgi:hypothetical protein
MSYKIDVLLSTKPTPFCLVKMQRISTPHANYLGSNVNIFRVDTLT